MTPPATRPANPNFSTGPCTKHPGWRLDNLAGALVGRSHRSAPGKAKLAEVIERCHAVLELPDDYRMAITPASDTGAFEMALWSMLGVRGVELLSWESFGSTWAADAVKHLRIDDVRQHKAEYGALPDLSLVDCDRDVVTVWNGTTSGVRLPHGDWIDPERGGLVFCDATSAAFAMALPWDKLDVTTFSWQKGLGSEAAHGMLILSPRAVDRLESYTPPWPLPKLFRLTKDGKLVEGLFRGETINTPSMICVEDMLDALSWAETVGGLPTMIARSEANLAAVTAWVGSSDWAAFLASEPETRSSTSICLSIVSPWFTALAPEDQARAVKRLAGLLEEEGVAFDIQPHRDAPPGLRFWGGATVETTDIEALLPWLDWAYGKIAEAT
ncbi:MAG: phosphoserine transaminase [Alphaproteobacteria bacterium]|jgi:phosphoserine aminotransferase